MAVIGKGVEVQVHGAFGGGPPRRSDLGPGRPPGMEVGASTRVLYSVSVDHLKSGKPGGARIQEVGPDPERTAPAPQLEGQPRADQASGGDFPAGRPRRCQGIQAGWDPIPDKQKQAPNRGAPARAPIRLGGGEDAGRRPGPTPGPFRKSRASEDPPNGGGRRSGFPPSDVRRSGPWRGAPGAAGL